MKILSVDDSRVVQRIVAGVVEGMGFEPLLASNGEEALEMLRAHEGDVSLVIMDWNMPVMDGFTCLERIRADAAFEGVPVMMLTTESEAPRIAQAIRAGAVNYLTKPFTPESLVAKVLQSLGKWGTP